MTNGLNMLGGCPPEWKETYDCPTCGAPDLPAVANCWRCGYPERIEQEEAD